MLHDDGACQHLMGARLPPVVLASTDGDMIELAEIPGRVLLYIYPRTSRPDEPPLEGWATIPGARGCTAQSCAFRDRHAELRSLNVTEVYGLSTQDSTYQREMVRRLGLPFPVLGDDKLEFATSLQIPTFAVGAHVLLKRVTLIIDDGAITCVFYPITLPERNPDEVVALDQPQPIGTRQ